MAHDVHQGEHHVLLALVGGLEQRRPLVGMPGHGLHGPAHVAGVQGIDAPAAVADGDDLAAQGLDEVHVVGLDVAQDHRVDPHVGVPDHHPPDQGGLAHPVEGQDHGRGRRDQAPLEPGDVVGGQVPLPVDGRAQRDADHGRDPAHDQRPQPAHLHRGAPPRLHVRPGGRPAAPGPALRPGGAQEAGGQPRHDAHAHHPPPDSRWRSGISPRGRPRAKAESWEP